MPLRKDDTHRSGSVQSAMLIQNNQKSKSACLCAAPTRLGFLALMIADTFTSPMSQRLLVFDWAGIDGGCDTCRLKWYLAAFRRAALEVMMDPNLRFHAVFHDFEDLRFSAQICSCALQMLNLQETG